MLNEDGDYICSINQMEAKEIFNLDTPEPIGTLYYIPMDLNGKRVNALYDPGAEMTSISSSFFRKSFSGVGVRPMVRNLSVALKKMFQ